MLSDSFLNYWVKGQQPLPPLYFYRRIKPDLNLGVLLVINDDPFFDSGYTRDIAGLKEAWDRNYAYYKNVKKFIFEYSGVNIETDYSFEILKEFRDDILEDYGYAPGGAYPIYIITLKKNGFEEIVYIGKTKNGISRFKK